MADLLFDGKRWIHSSDLARYMRRVAFFRVVEALPPGVFAVLMSDLGTASVVASYAWELSDVAAGWLRDECPDAIVVSKRPVLVPKVPVLVPEPFPPCCSLAVLVPCWCQCHWRCPEHGDKSYGSHD
jgi:hypothetical protein